MIDVLVYQTGDGATVGVHAGLIDLTAGLETAVLLSLFGGNDADGGDDATAAQQWWANFAERQPVRRLRSRTQHVLNRIAITTGSLRAVQDAALTDLAWLVEGGYVSDITVTASIVGPRRVKLEVRTPTAGGVVVDPTLASGGLSGGSAEVNLGFVVVGEDDFVAVDGSGFVVVR